MTVETGQPRLLQGNEAVVEGALYAGCRFFAGYPITPATEISEVMSWRLPAVDGTFIQMEDEIASMGAVIGASLGGGQGHDRHQRPGLLVDAGKPGLRRAWPKFPASSSTSCGAGLPPGCPPW